MIGAIPTAHNGQLFDSLPNDLVATVVSMMPLDTMSAFARTCRAAAKAVDSETQWYLRFTVCLVKVVDGRFSDLPATVFRDCPKFARNSHPCSNAFVGLSPGSFRSAKCATTARSVVERNLLRPCAESA